MSAADVRLRAALGGAPSAAVTALPEADRLALAQLLEDARARQTESLVTAFDATLKHVPFPLRRIVKKVLLG